MKATLSERSCVETTNVRSRFMAPDQVREADKRSGGVDAGERAVRWLFVNFHYGKDVGGGDSNLLKILKTLREERRKYPSLQ